MRLDWQTSLVPAACIRVLGTRIPDAFRLLARCIPATLPTEPCRSDAGSRCDRHGRNCPRLRVFRPGAFLEGIPPGLRSTSGPLPPAASADPRPLRFSAYKTSLAPTRRVVLGYRCGRSLNFP